MFKGVQFRSVVRSKVSAAVNHSLAFQFNWSRQFSAIFFWSSPLTFVFFNQVINLQMKTWLLSQTSYCSWKTPWQKRII